ncbi:MAG: hypothetical protein LBV46_01730 [Bacteroidales bacterium]|jgi:tetratricopeptide (TPR) repeat protein|nr:hypothetical protein [Bacteroidales bacterium]
MKKLSLLLLLSVSFALGNAQNCPFKYGATEVDSNKCLEELTNFQLYYNQKAYADAYPSWVYIVEHCPCSWNGVFVYAQTLLDNLIKVETDSATKEKLIDQLLWSYEARATYFPDKYTQGSGKGYKGYNIMRYRSFDFMNAYDLFVQSVDEEKEKTDPIIWNIYFATAEGITKQKRDTTIIIEAYERATEWIDRAVTDQYIMYDKTMGYIDNLDTALATETISKAEYDQRLKRLTDDTTRIMKMVDNYQKTLNNVELKFSPFAPCDVLIKVYRKKFEENKDNIEVLQKIVSTLSNKGCILDPLFMQVLEIVHTNNPSAKTAYMTGMLKMRDESTIDQAIQYLLQAISLFETNEQKAEPYYLLGVAYKVKNSYAEARSAALNMLKIKPNAGKAYILIGDLYANSGSRCSGGDAIPNANNWAAADKYARAVAVDPSVADAAAEARGKLRFPGKEDVFLRSLKAGDSYHVGCWIGETTTVR